MLEKRKAEKEALESKVEEVQRRRNQRLSDARKETAEESAEIRDLEGTLAELKEQTSECESELKKSKIVEQDLRAEIS